MGFRAFVEHITTRIFPARVAPFVQMIAEELEERPDDFNLHIFATPAGPYRVEVRYNEEIQRLVANAGLDEHSSLLVAQGVGVDFDLATNSAVIVTHYFDAIELNWRESRLLHRAVERMLTGIEFDQATALAAREHDFNEELRTA